MKSIIKKCVHKILCAVERIKYKLLFHDLNLDPWHLSGTFYCRNYKIKTLEMINRIKPDYYIDIGCGIGELLNKVKLKSTKKFGFDIDERLLSAIKKTNSKFYFSTNKTKFFNVLNKNITGKNNIIVVSLLGFSHKISDKKLIKLLNELYSNLGSYILITDSFYNKSKEYKYSHKDLLDRKEKIIEYVERIDKLRSLYCISLNEQII